MPQLPLGSQLLTVAEGRGWAVPPRPELQLPVWGSSPSSCLSSSLQVPFQQPSEKQQPRVHMHFPKPHTFPSHHNVESVDKLVRHTAPPQGRSHNLFTFDCKSPSPLGNFPQTHNLPHTASLGGGKGPQDLCAVTTKLLLCFPDTKATFSQPWHFINL